jgi:predicted PurR-regulated permease PerM
MKVVAAMLQYKQAGENMSKQRKIRLLGLVVAGILIVLGVKYFTNLLDFAKLLLDAFKNLIYGAMLAFLLNLSMDPIEKRLRRSKNAHIQKKARPLAMAVSFLILILILVGIITLIVPNMVQAGQVLVKSIPEYGNKLRDFLTKLFKDYPSIQSALSSSNVDWNDLINRILQISSKGLSGLFSSTINIMVSTVNGVVALFVIVVFAIYVLSEKERFVRLYHFFTNLYLTPQKTSVISECLNTLYNTFKAFLVGECIEALILCGMCMIGMFILQMPYALMISIMVGVINMIPMVGAFIGGGIGVFLIFTVSPIKALVFLVFLCIIQQIESNVFFPRIVGNKVGLPGIYVMITIVVGGSLAGVAGMILGVPLVASIYKLAVRYFQKKAQEKEEKAKKEQTLAAKPKIFTRG